VEEQLTLLTYLLHGQIPS